MTTEESTKNDPVDSTPLFSNQQALEQFCIKYLQFISVLYALISWETIFVENVFSIFFFCSFFNRVLFAVTQPNNNNLKRATLILQDFLQKPKSLMPLLNALEKSQKAEVRQVAAIYVREQVK